jgi:acyl carrier protein
MENVESDVIAIIERRLPSGKRDLSMTDRLSDLGIDSFSAIEMIFDLEEKFDIQIDYNSNDSQLQFETVGEVVAAIKRQVSGKS